MYAASIYYGLYSLGRVGMLLEPVAENKEVLLPRVGGADFKPLLTKSQHVPWVARLLKLEPDTQIVATRYPFSRAFQISLPKCNPPPPPHKMVDLGRLAS